MELGGQILAVGRSAEVEGVVADVEIETDSLACEQTLEIIDAVLAEAAADEREIGEEGDAWFGRRFGEPAGACPDVDPDRVRFEVRLLEVETHAVREFDQMDVEIVDVLVARDGAGRPETGVGERFVGGTLGRLDRDRAACLVGSGDDLLGSGGFRGKVDIAGDEDIALVHGPRLAKRAETILNSHFLERRLEQREIGVRVREYLGAQQT